MNPLGTAVDRLAYSPREAATVLGCSHQLIYDLLNAGQIRSAKVGARRLIPAAELQRFLDAHLEPQSAA